MNSAKTQQQNKPRVRRLLRLPLVQRLDCWPTSSTRTSPTSAVMSSTQDPAPSSPTLPPRASGRKILTARRNRYRIIWSVPLSAEEAQAMKSSGPATLAGAATAADDCGKDVSLHVLSVGFRRSPVDDWGASELVDSLLVSVHAL